MPQMMPMNWMLMFTVMNMIMLTVIMMLYNNSKFLPLPQPFNKSENTTKWMW